jgi:hypothetical protein
MSEDKTKPERSETPRTDALAKPWATAYEGSDDSVVSARFARNLERELADASEWIEKVTLEIRAIDLQAERITKNEQITIRDGADQEPREEDFDDVITGYKLNTGCWHRLLGLLATRSATSTTEKPAAAAGVPEEAKDAALLEARAALYGAREVCGSIGNIQHAIDLIDAALLPKERTP